jgi:DNA-binding CsgD family transcriptional regulator
VDKHLSLKIVKKQDFTADDQSFVNQVINVINNSELINPNKAMGFKDVDSIHVCCTSSYANLVGLLDKSSIKGLRDHDLPCEIFEFGDEYRKQDKTILKNTIECGYYSDEFFEANNFATHRGYLKISKYPIINQTSNHILGIGYEVDNIFLFNPAKKIIKDSKIKFSSSHRMNLVDKVSLSEMEKQVIYWFLQNLSDTETAKIISTIQKKAKPMSERTVQAHLNNVKTKLGVYNRQELHDILLELGYGTFIPESFFIKQTMSIREFQTPIYNN